jgi:hypothetical protein
MEEKKFTFPFPESEPQTLILPARTTDAILTKIYRLVLIEHMWHLYVYTTDIGKQIAVRLLKG